MPVDLPNLRDVAGLETADGRTVRPGVLLRSALPRPDDVVPSHVAWPPAVIIDLRSPMELQNGHPLAHLTPRVVNLPLLHALRPGALASDSLAALYHLVLDESAHLLVDVVREVAHADGPVLVHCAAGKDRTGVSVALVLRLLDVPHERVVGDYLLTEQAWAEIDARLHRDTEPKFPASYYQVLPEAIEAVLQVWDEHPAGVEGWFVDAGGDAETLERLRDRMLA